MTYRECYEIIFNCCKNNPFTREECEEIIVASGINNGRGIPERTWKALFNNNLFCIVDDNAFSFVTKEEKVSFGERQKHGFNFEKFVKKHFNIQDCPEGHYTYKWDGILDDHPVSIKTEQKGSDIEMASFVRNAANTDDFYLIVGFWEGQKDNIVSIETLFISGQEWHDLFNQEIVEECQNLINSITNDRSDDERWKSNREMLAKKWQEQTPNLIRPRFKRDHKTQKRMQCAINNTDFYKYFIPKYGKELKTNEQRNQE